MLVDLCSDELYPVYYDRAEYWSFGYEAPDDPRDMADIPDGLWTAYVLAQQAFMEQRKLLSAYLAAVTRDAKAYQSVAEVARKRAERGRQRPYRRPHPEGVKASGS